jgi:hypothetical protein
MGTKKTTTQKYKAGAYFHTTMSRYTCEELSSITRTLIRHHILDELHLVHNQLSPGYVRNLWAQAIEEPETNPNFEYILPATVLHYINQVKDPPTKSPNSEFFTNVSRYYGVEVGSSFVFLSSGLLCAHDEKLPTEHDASYLNCCGARIGVVDFVDALESGDNHVDVLNVLAKKIVRVCWAVISMGV